MPRVPRVILLVAAALGALLGLSVVYGMVQAFSGSRTNWAVFGFEAITLLAAGFALIHARGRFTHAPALLYANIVLVVVVSTGLGLVSLGLPPRKVLVHPFMLARLGIAAAYGVLILAVVFRARRSLWLRFAMGGILTALPLLASAGAWMTRSSWLAPTQGITRIAITSAAIIGSLVAIGVLCAGVHQLIRAFELGSDHPDVTDTRDIARSCAGPRQA